MKKLLVLSTFLVILVRIESAEETKDEARNSLSANITITNNFTTELKNKDDDNFDPKSIRKTRSSPVGSIGAYITNYWEKKKRKAIKNKNKTKWPVKRPSDHRRHKHCYYDYYK